jgi:hypothetical protein
MKTIKFLFLTALVISINVLCSANTGKKDKNAEAPKAGKVEVFYFHYTHRCATCRAVESVSKEAVADLYGNKVSFTGYNLDEKAGKAKGKELGVSGQTLLIVAGDKKIDITNEGFMNARSNPEKLKQIIREKIDSLL